jgi:uncharacterized protein (TIGR02271 family)
MTTTQDLQNMQGQTALDVNGDKLGKIGQIYVDDQTSAPLWVTIATGMFGTKESFAPLYGSNASSDGLQLAVSKDMVKDAPGVDADGHIGDSENEALYDYYAGYLGNAAQQDVDSREDRSGRDGIQGSDTSGPTTDGAMTRSEERLHVGTEQAESGRARLRKHVVTEQVTQTVPVSHEEVRLEREPITDANRGDANRGDANRGDAMSGSDISEEEHEVTLHAERPVVEKEAVPVERVKVGTETVTEDHEVSETLRKEQIDDPDTDQPGNTNR